MTEPPTHNLAVERPARKAAQAAHFHVIHLYVRTDLREDR
jgi:hypothetical protein